MTHTPQRALLYGSLWWLPLTPENNPSSFAASILGTDLLFSLL